MDLCASQNITIEKIEQLQAVIADMPQVEMAPVHHFAKGLYARELLIPKDTMLVGKIHKHEHIIIVLSGDISISVGSEIVRVKAPFVSVAPPGTKRIGYAHEDTIVMNIHATDCTDVDMIEADAVVETFDQYQLFIGV